MGKLKKPKIPRQPAISFEDFAEADRVFQESLSGLLYNPAPSDPSPQTGAGPTFPVSPKKGQRAEKRRRVDHPVIDLHGLTLQQAKEYLDDRISRLLGAGSDVLSVKIVTGKGLHSGPGGGVLAREIHRHVAAVYGHLIVSIEDSPGDTVIRGLPLRGHFNLRIRRS